MLSLARSALNVVYASTFFSYSRLKKLRSLDILLLYDHSRRTLRHYIDRFIHVVSDVHGAQGDASQSLGYDDKEKVMCRL